MDTLNLRFTVKCMSSSSVFVGSVKNPILSGFAETGFAFLQATLFPGSSHTRPSTLGSHGNEVVLQEDYRAI